MWSLENIQLWGGNRIKSASWVIIITNSWRYQKQQETLLCLLFCSRMKDFWIRDFSNCCMCLKWSQNTGVILLWFAALSQVEFPEARIYEETLNALLYETLPVPDNSLLEATRRRAHCCSHSEEDESVELRERVRRIHIKRYSTYDDRPLGH